MYVCEPTIMYVRTMIIVIKSPHTYSYVHQLLLVLIDIEISLSG